jgi:hypothetical protein
MMRVMSQHWNESHSHQIISQHDTKQTLTLTVIFDLSFLRPYRNFGFAPLLLAASLVVLEAIFGIFVTFR